MHRLGMWLTPHLLPLRRSYSGPTVTSSVVALAHHLCEGSDSRGQPPSNNLVTLRVPSIVARSVAPKGPVLGKPRAVPLATQPITWAASPAPSKRPPTPNACYPIDAKRGIPQNGYYPSALSVFFPCEGKTWGRKKRKPKNYQNAMYHLPHRRTIRLLRSIDCRPQLMT